MRGHNKRKGETKSLKMGGIYYPAGERENKFCERWLVHKNELTAWREAGYADSGAKAGLHKKKLQKLLPYLSTQLERHETQVAKQFVLDQQQIIDEMIAIGFANPQDYLKQVEKEIDVEVNGKATKQTVLYTVQKDIHELTRREAAAISEVRIVDGKALYRIPDDPKAKHPYLKDLGQHLGLFHPKLIQEHRHQHLHAKLSFANLDQGKLEALEAQLVDAMGDAGRRMLGITIDGEAENVDEG